MPTLYLIICMFITWKFTLSSTTYTNKWYIYIGYITRTISIIFFLHYGLICIVRLQRRVKIYLFFVLKKNLRPPNPPLLTVVAIRPTGLVAKCNRAAKSNRMWPDLDGPVVGHNYYFFNKMVTVMLGWPWPDLAMGRRGWMFFYLFIINSRL